MDKETEEKRQRFIQEMAENGGDYKAAAKKAGYTQSYAEKLRRTVREAIRKATFDNFADELPQASKRLKDLMKSENESISLKAVLAYMDRNGMEGWTGIKGDNASHLSDAELEAKLETWRKQKQRNGQDAQGSQDDDHPEDTEKEERTLRVV